MNAIAEYLEAWENDQPVRTSGMDDRQARQAETNEPLEPSATTASEPSARVMLTRLAVSISRRSTTCCVPPTRLATSLSDMTSKIRGQRTKSESNTLRSLRVMTPAAPRGAGSTRRWSGRSPDENKVPALRTIELGRHARERGPVARFRATVA